MAGVDSAPLLLVERMQQGPTAEVLVECFHTTTCNADLRSDLGEAGVCEALVKGLRQHKTNAEVQPEGFYAISSLTKSIPVNRTRLIHADACGAIAEALIEHKPHPGVCEQAYAAISSIIYNDDCHDDHRKAFRDVCAAIVGALREHITRLGVCNAGIAAIAGLCFNCPTNRSGLGESGACEVLMAAVRTHVAAFDAQQHSVACAAIANLCSDNPSNAMKLAREGACEIVITTLSAHITDADISNAGCFAILSLCSAPENASELEKFGAYQVLATVMRAHPTHCGVDYFGQKAQKALACKDKMS